MLSEKKFEKIEKTLGKEMLQELEALASRASLEAKIAEAEGAVKRTVDELEANEEYQARRQGLLDMSAGLKDVKKRQKAITEYCLHLLEEAGQQ